MQIKANAEYRHTHIHSGGRSAAAIARADQLKRRVTPIRVARQVSDLADVLADGVQALIFNREPPSEAARYLARAIAERQLTQGFRRMVAVANKPLDLPLPPLAGADALRADVSHLIELLTDLTDCSHVGLRLELLTGAMCPRFHVDKGSLRMLCTYIGVGTDVLDDRLAQRDEVLKDPNSAVPPEAIISCATGAIVLLRGEGLQGSPGAIHRSPSAGLRVLLAMDPLWLEDAA